MGGYEPENYDDVSNFLTFSDDEDDPSTPTASNMDEEMKPSSTPLSPPPSSIEGDTIDLDDQEEEDLYANAPDEDMWKVRRDSSVSASLASPVDPQWLLSSAPPQSDSVVPDVTQSSQPSPSDSEEKSKSVRRTALETIQERNDQLVKTSVVAKSSKSFPLLPDLLSLKQAEDEDEKILHSEEGKKLNPKERRQLRNKVSARNFRVRRKGPLLRFCLTNFIRVYWTP